MRRYFVNLDTNNLQPGRSDQGSIGQSARGAAGAVACQFGGSEQFQLGFIRTGDQVNLDQGADIGGALILKQPTDTSSYDGPALTKCIAWTKTTDTSVTPNQIWYTGILPLSRLELAKLLGVSVRTAREKLLVQCGADVDGSLDGTVLQLAIDRASADGVTPTHFCYFDFHITAGVNTVPGTGSFEDRVTLAANDSDATVATKFAARVNARTADIGWTAVADGANVTLTASTVRLIGQHDALSSGFPLALLALGGNAGALPDVASVPLNAEFSYLVSGARQICTGFTLTLNNTLYRDGQLTIPSGLTLVSTLDVTIGVPATGYTGGAGNLDGIATASGAMSTGQVVWFIHATEGIRFHQLTAGTDATASPGVIRPGDYNAGTNARVWKQVA